METYQVNSIPFNHSQLYIKTNYSCSDSNQKKKVNSNLKAEKEEKKKKREEKEIYYPVNLYIYTLSPIAYQLLQTCKQGVDVV
jgi:hypothetical protein